jgi:hypothetical protein
MNGPSQPVDPYKFSLKSAGQQALLFGLAVDFVEPAFESDAFFSCNQEFPVLLQQQ